MLVCSLFCHFGSFHLPLNVFFYASRRFFYYILLLVAFSVCKNCPRFLGFRHPFNNLFWSLLISLPTVHSAWICLLSVDILIFCSASHSLVPTVPWGNVWRPRVPEHYPLKLFFVIGLKKVFCNICYTDFIYSNTPQIKRNESIRHSFLR